jgi:CrcB protein
MLILLAFVGGSLGSALRFLISEAAETQSLALWIVNLSGALVLGFVHVSPHTKSRNLQALLATGFAGGFTTVSALVTFAILSPSGSVLVVAEQVALGILAYWLGRIIGGDRNWLKS